MRLGRFLHAGARALALAALLSPIARPAVAATQLDPVAAERFAALALACVHKEYPNRIAHVLSGDADVLPPRSLTPAFYGCYDWHSAVHAHWLLARIARQFPAGGAAAKARTALAASLTPAKIGSELNYLRGAGRVSFERPYGLAWLLALAAELRAWDDPQAQAWVSALAPLEAEAAARVSGWLPKLAYPIRVGEHSQTAFAFGLIHDWARVAGNKAMLGLLGSRGRYYYLADRDCPIAYEPSGEDFLSPCLAEADFMRRILPPREYAQWLTAFLPRIPKAATADWLAPGVVTDRSDPKLVHLDGLNLSRAWCMRSIAAALPTSDPARKVLSSAADQHATAALAHVASGDYAGEHWLASFAIFLLSN